MFETIWNILITFMWYSIGISIVLGIMFFIILALYGAVEFTLNTIFRR